MGEGKSWNSDTFSTQSVLCFGIISLSLLTFEAVIRRNAGISLHLPLHLYCELKQLSYNEFSSLKKEKGQQQKMWQLLFCKLDLKDCTSWHNRSRKKSGTSVRTRIEKLYSVFNLGDVRAQMWCTSFSRSSEYACDVIGLDLCPSAPVRNERARLPSRQVYLDFERAKWSKRGGKKKIPCQLFLHKILEFSLLWGLALRKPKPLDLWILKVSKELREGSLFFFFLSPTDLNLK